MKYMIILFGDESQWSGDGKTEELVAAEMQAHVDYFQWCQDNGIAITAGEELELSPAAVTFRQDGTMVDGPFLELKEQLGGFYVIETDSPELAREAASRCPNYGANELRPVTQRD